MARLEQMIESEKSHLLALPCPTFDSTPWVTGPPIKNRRIALISTAGLHCRGDRPFEPGAMDYRAIPADTPADSRKLSEWFWSETAAAQAINRMRIVCMKTKDKSLKFLGQMLLVPRNQLHRFKHSERGIQ